MAYAPEAPATSTTAEGPTQHTQNQPVDRFTAPQLRLLHMGINPNRVQNLRGMSHLEAWDVRRELIRVFGFGGFDIETLSLDLVSENGEMRRKKTREGKEYGDPYMAWTIVYRAQVRLIVKDVHGRSLAHWDDGAAGDAVNQPSLGDAHDLAMKTAVSQALKRCAVNLGDQFGLSLYNDGSPQPVVRFSAAHPPEQWQKREEEPSTGEDPPVRPEPKPEPRSAEPTASAPQPPQSDTAPTVPAPERLDELMGQVRRCWTNSMALTQVLGDADAHGCLDADVQGPDGQWRTLRELVNNQINALNLAQQAGNDTERRAA
ncbi:Rad52/Rad22 family DNA repair protein [Streptomyces sp. NPDC060243]|uniref:Rad52/Rad22 family DNA repair protein n=1 Tax=Streptomyces sp. NPDC060243 TaxID=3347081 RepID=UPI00364C2829